MFSTIWMCTQEWSLIPSRRVAFTADTCHHALTCSSELTASSSASSRRLPRVGARTRTSANASRGGIAGSRGATGPSRLGTGDLEQQPLADPADPHPQRRGEALRGRLQDQQAGRQQPHALDV